MFVYLVVFCLEVFLLGEFSRELREQWRTHIIQNSAQAEWILSAGLVKPELR